MLSRGIRNCNPGNIRRSVSLFRGEVTPSQDLDFKQFESEAWGYRAMFLIIHNYGELYGIKTLDAIIGRWAPASENYTSEYIRCVSRRLGVEPHSYIDSLSGEVMRVMVGAMSYVENGVAPDKEAIDEGWRLFAENK